MRSVLLKMMSLIWLLGIYISGNSQTYNITPALEFNMGTPIGKLRSVPITYAKNTEGLLVVYCEDKEVDPYEEMFFFAKHQLKIVLFDLNGKEIWRKIMPKMVMPGIWFCPVLPFDLNGDGIDEIYCTNNTDLEHPFAQTNYVLDQLDVSTGESLAQYKWENFKYSSGTGLGMRFRYFIIGAEVKGEKRLITALGTYGQMMLQAYNSKMEKQWELIIPDHGDGARGSHMSALIDINKDGIDELMWGERCINLSNGEYLFVADRKEWAGHSDVVQPVLNKADGNWYIYTCRETGGFSPRVVTFNSKGERVWGDLETGHMDMGCVANLGENGEPVAMAIKIGKKVAGNDGFIRTGVEEYIYEVFTGMKMNVPFPVFNTLPVDLNGDGIHELVCAFGEQGDRNIYNNKGQILGNVGENGMVAMASKFLNLPGEQFLVYYPNGDIKVYSDKNAADNEIAERRYQNPFYQKNRKLTASGYNLINLGGL